MSPEQRAKALLVYMSQLPDVPDVDATISVFATAIKEAEDAAYERAAAHVELIHMEGAHPIGEEIRSLKSQEP